MKLAKLFTLMALLGMALIGCQESAISPVDSGGSYLSDEDQLRKLIDEDETLNSFEANYNEEEAMELLGGGLSKEIFPVRVGHRMKLINKVIEIDIEDDSAFAHVTKTFEGTLFIAASFEEFQPTDEAVIDTVVEKPFTTVVTHNVIFTKRNDWGFSFFGNGDPLGNGSGEGPQHDGEGIQHRGDKGDRGQHGDHDLHRRAWRIVAISLVEGGTGSTNIAITKLTLILPDGKEIVVESPNEYYLYRMLGRPDQVPTVSSGETVVLKVEVESAYSDADFVSLTFGARHDRRFNRKKQLLELISEEFNGEFYSRTFQTEWVPRYDRGPKHAVINAVPRQVIYDDETEVESNSWGTPYIIR
jgi:hypothetical protein